MQNDVVENGAESRTRPPGRGLAIAAVALVPAVVVAFVVGTVVGSLIQEALGLAADENLRAAGALGLLAAAGLIALLCTPQSVGLLLALRARRLGQRGLATVGLIANGILLLYLLATSAVGLILA